MKNKSIGILLLSACLLAGCGSRLDVDCDTVYVQKKGTVVSASIEPFEKDYYDAEELKAFVDDEIASYQEKYVDASLELDKFGVENDTAKLYIKFGTCDEYARFNGVELFNGSVVQAQAEGYQFDTELVEVENGNKKDGKVDIDPVINNVDNKVVIIKQNIDVKVPGKVLYVSAQNTTLKGKDTVSIGASEDSVNPEDTVLSYIIYK